MNAADVRALLEEVQSGTLEVAAASERLTQYLRQAPFEDIGFARVDHHRDLRQGIPEAIFGAGKSPAQIVRIAERMLARGGNVLVTRTDAATHAALTEMAPGAVFHPDARAITLQQRRPPAGVGVVMTIAAGTSDIPVAEEAAVTTEFLGNQADRIYDVGVAGIHRLLREYPRLGSARVIIVVAGMEGALPSVVGGLVAVPVIAVPTSVGYGASLGGLAALLGMLNSCAAGVSVVNIDNGFGAGVIASLINHL
ncbi:MAG: nickel pincer cofactor biosynthesis protein LarB [Acidobacteria bacterium]|nr:nickel pincer cofactor biosynthesis protein LarB [Acidobacteriota bacterium]